jgi:hypothetical protein
MFVYHDDGFVVNVRLNGNVIVLCTQFGGGITRGSQRILLNGSKLNIIYHWTTGTV